ncbi:hypothetical protein C8A05DRAFT_12194 [Staphylotrichum tortipilum]|uniref:Copper acquisition factor BIM1-like domain-containing protein n=1 Tax=Staphylotrichum tortipilum TaxID=2831512 RepID=A0AAN6MT18_9PEZI|nr:hypothetical protein C8A05DRAFT_12194 [Staphylotrichum longicolle]
MAPLRSLATAGLLFLSGASAQFLLNFPPSLEGKEVSLDLQTTGACGGGIPNLPSNAAVDFHIDGDVVALDIKQDTGNILFGATLDAHANGGWQQLYPIVQIQGQGTYCQKGVIAPKEWLGKMGIIGIVLKVGEQQRYQCAAVNFVAGVNTAVRDSCKNSTTVHAGFESDMTLSGMVNVDPANATSGTNSDGTHSKSGAASLSGLSFAAVAAMVLAGAAQL